MYSLIPSFGNSQVIRRNSDKACIPADPQNLDYQSYLEWIAGGNEPTSYVAPTTPVDFIALAEAHIGKSFSPLIVIDGVKRIFEADKAGTLASIPKTIEVATWVEMVKQTALSGSTDFPPPPDFTTQEILSE